jgi:hypothetical protein
MASRRRVDAFTRDTARICSAASVREAIDIIDSLFPGMAVTTPVTNQEADRLNAQAAEYERKLQERKR